MIAGRYRLGEEIGSGGMGRVWLAHDERLDRDVAIKEIVLQTGSEEDAAVARRRTLREARAAARLNHPGVVAVYDVFEADGKPWIVMEHVPSRSLKEVVQQDGPLEDRQAAVIGLQILEALEAAHRAGVQHRDVKPANVLITEDGRVVLTDFGIATIEGDALVTSSGQLHVSLDYMAPERAQEGQATDASDLWSLGATLYDAVEGHAPFHRASAVGTLTAIAVDPPDTMERPTSLAPVIAGLLQKDPGKRLSSAEAGKLLQAVADGKAPRAVATPAAPAKKDQNQPGVRTGARRPALLIAAAAVVVVLALVAFVVFRPDGSSGPTNDDNVSAEQTGTPAPSSVPSEAPASAAASPSPSAAAPASPTPTPTTGSGGEATGGRPQLPAGWKDYKDPTGFSVYVPNGWSQQQRGTMVYFVGNNGRVLGIDQTKTPQPNPVADWRSQSSSRVAGGDFPNYREFKIAEVAYFQKAADWEWSYDDPNLGRRVHVNNRGVITSPTQAYGIYWQTDDSDWAAAQADLQTIFASFVPAS
ncbi:protein kinase [Catenuloplanes sp. NPDC051500]|uniref:serine/threonine-protein kinase n=1 Tax=Catenuloplanes sp. NPDC051500 TaxID=3363959 RepID=UPI003797F8CA